MATELLSSDGTGVVVKPGAGQNLTVEGGLVTLVDGTATDPAIRFVDDGNTGLFSPANESVSLTGDGAEVLRATGVPVGVNYIEITNSAAGDRVSIVAVGSDPNISIEISGKGTGGIILNPGGTGDFDASSRKIINLDDPINPQDAATRAFVLANGGGSAGGTNTQIQYNSSDSFGGDTGFTTDGSGSVNIVGDLDVDNLNLNGNTISSTNTDGNIVLDPNGTGLVQTVSGYDMSTGPSYALATKQYVDDNAGGPGGSPGGANTQVQFNDSNSFAGDSALTWNKTTDTLSIGNLSVTTNTIASTNVNGDIILDPNGSGSVKLGNAALKFPNTDGELGDVLVTDGSAQLSWGTSFTPFVGAMVTRSGSSGGAADMRNTILPWDTLIYDTSSFYSGGANTRLTIPAGSGITRVRVGANVQSSSVTASAGVQIYIRWNGTLISSSPNVAAAPGYTVSSCSVSSGPIEVSEGDYFDVRYDSTDSSTTIDAQSNFWIESLSRTLTSAFYDVAGSYGGAFAGLAEGTRIFHFIAVRPFSMTPNFSGSLAIAKNGAAGSPIFSIKKTTGGLTTLIGTITFSGTTGTFSSTNGDANSLMVGDELEIFSPDDPQDASLGNIAWTIRGTI